MPDFPWKVRGICLDAPKSEYIDMFEEFVEKKLVPGGCNLIVMQILFGYKFKTHPECTTAREYLDEAEVKRIVAICRKHGVRLMPLMNLMGHMTFRNVREEGFIVAHPEFDETPHLKEVFYGRCICPNHPDIKPIMFDLMDEMVDVFESDAIHVGLDEVFELGKCERCKNTPTYRLFADWTNALADHNSDRGKKTYIWGDRLLNGLETGYGGWEGSGNFTEPAIDLIRKNIVICDWHYEDNRKYPSIEIFADAGFRLLVSPWRYINNAKKFIDYAIANDRGHIDGFLATTWLASDLVMRYMLNGEIGSEVATPAGAWDDRSTIIALCETLNWLFGTAKS